MPTYEEHLETLMEIKKLWEKHRVEAMRDNNENLLREADHAVARADINIQITKEFIIQRDSKKKVDELMEKAKHV